jgi:hypothetical protein
VLCPGFFRVAGSHGMHLTAVFFYGRFLFQSTPRIWLFRFRCGAGLSEPEAARRFHESCL